MGSMVLTDDDVRRVMPMSAAVDRIESALREHAEGTLVAPPRFRVDVAKGALIFTAGVVGKHTGRYSPDDRTPFCTAGLSGTEVAVASEALRRAGHREGL
jgi:ornithine cyclodeaminase/alanine dehydrogenase-like protein (mu-crystallin family)